MISSNEIFTHIGISLYQNNKSALPVPIPTPVRTIAVSTTYSKVRCLTESGQ